jgi:hypothetical protein
VTATEIPILKAGASSALPDPIAAHAAQRFADAGVLTLKGLLPAERVTALHEAYAIEYGDIGCRSTGNHIMEVGDKRLMITLGVSGIFAAPEIFAHPVALSIVSPLLGNDCLAPKFSTIPD